MAKRGQEVADKWYLRSTNSITRQLALDIAAASIPAQLQVWAMVASGRRCGLAMPLGQPLAAVAPLWARS